MGEGKGLPPDMQMSMDQAIERLRADWAATIRRLADANEALAEGVEFRGDQECADSMRFCATRLRRIAERETGEG